MHKKIPCILCHLLLLVLPVSLWGQITEPPRPDGPDLIFQQIDRAYQKGELSLEQNILQKFYVALDREKVMDRFRPLPEELQIRCLTPLIIEYERDREQLSPAAREELQYYILNTCSRPQTDYSLTTETGRFTLHYSLEDPHAVPSEDYVQRAAFAADSSWNHQIGRLGFEDPVLFPSVRPYDIYFKDLDFYGAACSDGATSYFAVHNNFEGFPPNHHPEDHQTGALYATVAHEFKHASQYATNRWNCSSEEENRESGCPAWVEMDAVLMEEIVFDDVNDYYNYIKSGGIDSYDPNPNSIFGTPSEPIPVAYDHATWMLYFAETLGMSFWLDVWDQFKVEANKPFLDAVKQSLGNRGESFAQHHTRNLIWHMGSGPDYSAHSGGFSESLNYPHPNFDEHFTHAPDSVGNKRLSPLAANFHRVRPVSEINGQIQVKAEHDRPSVGLGLITYFKTGHTDIKWVTGREEVTEIQTSWNWHEIREMGIAIVNYSETESTRYHLTVDKAIPQQITLSENYPNPFNPTTRFEVGVDRPTRVRLEIYDTLGRKVRTLADRNFEPGFYLFEFDGQGLASGIYFYRMVADDQTYSRKMVLIK
ncbi:MAG: T9SS type A sorting domain-containing protein [Balneolaceae bacterium]